LLLDVQTSSGAHPVPATLSRGGGGGGSVRDVKLTGHLHLVPRLKMSGVVPPVPPHALMTCIGAALLFYSSTLCSVHTDGVVKRS
jgi:hypothetical protein